MICKQVQPDLFDKSCKQRAVVLPALGLIRELSLCWCEIIMVDMGEEPVHGCLGVGMTSSM